MSDLLDGPGWDKSRGARGPLGRADEVVEWFGSYERSVLIGGVVLQLLVLFGMMASRAATLLTGETILLRVAPVDPRDLLRGDYVILNYQINAIPVRSGFGVAPGQTVYVTLVPEPDGRHYMGDGADTTPPPPGIRYIRGTLTARGQIEYGIESYFVQEGKGKAYEDAIRSRRLSAEVALGPDGQAVLRGLRIE